LRFVELLSIGGWQMELYGRSRGSIFTVSFPTTEAIAPAIELDRAPTIAGDKLILQFAALPVFLFANRQKTT
jgi:hypothetical protein